MLNPAVSFIRTRVVADYVRLYKTGNAPAAKCYAAVWSEYAQELVCDVLFTEYRLRRETDPAFSVENFLQGHLDCGDYINEEFIQRLLEHELMTAQPKTNTVIANQNLPPQPEPPPSEPPQPEAHATVTIQAEKNNIHTATVEGWTPEQTKTFEWSVGQSLPPDNDGTMDFQLAAAAPDTTMDFLPATAVPDATMDFQPVTAMPDATIILKEQNPFGMPFLAGRFV